MTELDKLRGLGGSVVEVHCACPAEVAVARYNAWSRHEVHVLKEMTLTASTAGQPVLVVLDEFPYMARSAAGLPSIIQHALSPRGMARTKLRARRDGAAHRPGRALLR